MWSPDGASVIFTRFRGTGVGEWYRRAANLAGDEELLFRARDQGVPSSDLARTARFVLFTGPLPGPADIQAVDLGACPEAREAIPLVSSQFNEANARFSPDGRWFAYASNESGTYEIYVRPFNPDAAPGAAAVGGRPSDGVEGRRHRRAARSGARTARNCSTSRPTERSWRWPSAPSRRFSVSGPPQALFKLPSTLVFFDVSSDGQRFLMPVPEGAGSAHRRTT